MNSSFRPPDDPPKPSRFNIAAVTKDMGSKPSSLEPGQVSSSPLSDSSLEVNAGTDSPLNEVRRPCVASHDPFDAGSTTTVHITPLLTMSSLCGLQFTEEDTIDMETFRQILELDEDGHDFSRGMAWAYFSQASGTFQDMDDALCVLHHLAAHSLTHSH